MLHALQRIARILRNQAYSEALAIIVPIATRSVVAKVAIAPDRVQYLAAGARDRAREQWSEPERVTQFGGQA
ncbi:hypothetical protein C1931_12105 [Stenotrophomonas sp. YAU14A_MKIMI4_1]|nr:hypothetical protein C1931_12105 [Stenotrophomonas sp. YAU14A_MKIMI4_1]